MNIKEKIQKAQILNWLESENKYLDFLCDSWFICSSKSHKDFSEKILQTDVLHYMISAHEKASNMHQILIERLKHEIDWVNKTPRDQNVQKTLPF